jgi:tetratricopeptide (TPR) repeat protein
MIDPKRIDAYIGQAAIWRKKNDLDETIAAYDRAIAADQNQPASYKLRAEAYAAKGERKRALADLDRALRLTWTVNLLKERSGVRLADGDTEGALSDAEAMLKLAPGNADAIALRDKIAAQQKQAIAAREAPPPARKDAAPTAKPTPQAAALPSKTETKIVAPKPDSKVDVPKAPPETKADQAKAEPKIAAPKVPAPKITDRLPALETKPPAPKPDSKAAEPKKAEADAKTGAKKSNPMKDDEKPVPLPPPREKAVPVSPQSQQASRKDDGEEAAKRHVERKPQKMRPHRPHRHAADHRSKRRTHTAQSRPHYYRAGADNDYALPRRGLWHEIFK